MITVIHGDLQEESRSKLIALKTAAAYAEIREVAGKGLDPTALTQALESSSLFGGEVLVVIEGLLSNANKRTKSFGAIVDQLAAAGSTTEIILYEDKEIDKTIIAKLGTRVTTHLYKTPVILFQFLDNLRPDSSHTLLPQFAALMATEKSEVVFAMIVRRVRQLIQVVDHETPEGLQSWQLARLTSQGRHFTIDKLVVMHEQLLGIDIALKTGSSPYTLAQHIEQFLISL